MQPAPDPTPPDASVITDDLRCSRCGYNLRGLGRSGKCPECGIEISHAETRLDIADPKWRMARGIGQLYWLAFLMLPLLLWLDEPILRFVAAVGNVVCAFRIATPEKGTSADDPQAWLSRALRLAAVAVLLLAAYSFYCFLASRFHQDFPWVDAYRDNGYSYGWLVAAGACVVFGATQLKRISHDVSFQTPATRIVPLAWVSAIALLLFTMLSLDQVPDGWQDMARLARSGLALVQAIVWMCILLLAGRLRERIRAFLSSAPENGSKSPEFIGLPRTRFGCAIVLVALFPIAFHGTALPYGWYVFMIGYGIGVWLLARSLNPILHKQFAWLHAMHLSAAAIVVGSCAHFALCMYNAPRRVPSVLQYPLAILVIDVLLIVAFAACAWTSFAALEHTAAEVGQGSLKPALGRRKWSVAAAVAAGELAGLVLPSGYYTYSFDVYELIRGASVLIVLESLLILGRAWQAIEGRLAPDTQGPVPALPGQH